LQSLEAAIVAKADNAALSALDAEVKAGFMKLAAANNAVSSAVSVSLKVTDAPGIPDFTVDIT
jgi:hypothetical protein